MNKKMLSSIHTLYLVYLKHKVPLHCDKRDRSHYLRAKQSLSMAVSVCALEVADARNMKFNEMNDIVLATNFFIEKWRNDVK